MPHFFKHTDSKALKLARMWAAHERFLKLEEEDPSFVEERRLLLKDAAILFEEASLPDNIRLPDMRTNGGGLVIASQPTHKADFGTRKPTWKDPLNYIANFSAWNVSLPILQHWDNWLPALEAAAVQQAPMPGTVATGKAPKAAAPPAPLSEADINSACTNFVNWAKDTMELNFKAETKEKFCKHLLERHNDLCWLSNQDPIPTLTVKETLSLSKMLAIIDKLRLPQALNSQIVFQLGQEIIYFEPDNIALASLRNTDPLMLKRLKLVLEKNSPQIEKEAASPGNKEPDATGNGKTGAENNPAEIPAPGGAAVQTPPVTAPPPAPKASGAAVQDAATIPDCPAGIGFAIHQKLWAALFKIETEWFSAGALGDKVCDRTTRHEWLTALCKSNLLKHNDKAGKGRQYKIAVEKCSKMT